MAILFTLCWTTLYLSSVLSSGMSKTLPLVVNTWEQNGYRQAAATAWTTLEQGGDRMEALIAGGERCQQLQCDGTVGFGGSPDEQGETTLDALVLDGVGMRMGAVAALRRVKNAIGVAHAVMKYTKHSILAGDQATQFAVQMGFKEETLSTNESTAAWNKWKENNCQPNYRQNVQPNPRSACGPYTPQHIDSNTAEESSKSHDTLGMIVIDTEGNIAAGTTSNGAGHKVPGRVGDAPIPGAGAYVDNAHGAAVATGDGDYMMRLLPTFTAVELLSRGYGVEKAAEEAISRIRSHFPCFNGAVVVADKKGNVAAACNGFNGSFPYSLRRAGMSGVEVRRVKCTKC